MSRYAIVENNKIINVVISDEEYAKQQGWIFIPNDAGIDWDYVDGVFVDNRTIPENLE